MRKWGLTMKRAVMRDLEGWDLVEHRMKQDVACLAFNCVKMPEMPEML